MLSTPTTEQSVSITPKQMLKFIRDFCAFYKKKKKEEVLFPDTAVLFVMDCYLLVFSLLNNFFMWDIENTFIYFESVVVVTDLK